MKTEELVNALNGLQTIRSVQQTLNIDRARAIYLLYRLRKEGYLKTTKASDQTRRYRISPENRHNPASYIDIINKNTVSGCKLMAFKPYIIHGRSPSTEEAIIYALGKRDIRWIIALLGSFRKIKDWNLLYRLAKKEYLVREVAALYDVARLVVRKVRRMPKRFKTLATPKRQDRYKYIVEDFSSLHFQNIEKKWKVYIPLNWGDLEEYKYD